MKKRILSAALAAVMLLGVLTIGPLPAQAQSNMTVSDKGEAMIKAFEGFRAVPNWDNKQNSVGWGCSITAEQWAVTEKNPDGTITQAAAQQLLDAAMLKHGNEVNEFAGKYGLTLTQGQFDALTSLSFNIGGSWMRKTDWHIFKAVTSGDKGAYLAYAFALYSTSGGVTTQGHLKRRLLELQMYLYDIYDTDRGWPEGVRYVLLDGNGGSSEYNPHGFNINNPISASDMWVNLTAPTGKDGSGKPFTYQFAGWFTKPVGGQQVLTLDASLEDGMILYAHWKNPTTGEIDDLQPGTAADVKVKATGNVTLREGPCTYYTTVRTAYSGELLHIKRVVSGKDGYQWGLTSEGWVRLDSTNYGTTGGGSSKPQTPGTYATVTASNVQIRTGPGTSYNKTGSYVQTGSTYLLLATQRDGSGNNWGKIGENQWFCLEYNGNSYATIQVITDTPTQPSTPSAPDISGAITVKSVEIKELPTQREYALGGLDRVPDLTGGRIKVTLSNGTAKWINMTRGMISGFDNSKTGANTVTVSVGGKSDTFTVRIVPVNISGIAMENYPKKTQYLKNTDKLDLTGVTITVKYSPTGMESVAVTADMVSGFDNTVTGTQTIVVTYKGFTTSFLVEVVSNDAQGISMATLPNKLQYLMGVESLDLTGASIKINYSQTGEQTVIVTGDMVTGFQNTTAGMQKLTVTYQGFTTSFDVEIVRPKVTFFNYDGSVILSSRYDYGAAVTPPADPTRPADEHGEYEFVGWDREITACTGNAAYTAVYALVYPMGDVNRDMTVNEDDVIYLLRHLVYPEQYPCSVAADYNKDGSVDEDDVIYLLRHLVYPDLYPLS